MLDGEPGPDVFTERVAFCLVEKSLTFDDNEHQNPKDPRKSVVVVRNLRDYIVKDVSHFLISSLMDFSFLRNVIVVLALSFACSPTRTSVAYRE